ncbi:unnamed protein product [Effrenium voratum]|nr:unnamed protein product [Effrenium voratum]
MFSGFSMATQTSPEKPKRADDVSNLLPVTLRMLETAHEASKSTEGELRFHGAETSPGLLMMLAQVETLHAKQDSMAEFTVCDATARLRARFFATDKTQEKAIQSVTEGNWVKLFGQFRAAPTPHFSVSILREVKSADEISHHLIEVVHAALKNRQHNGRLAQPEPAQPAQPAPEPEPESAERVSQRLFAPWASCRGLARSSKGKSCGRRLPKAWRGRAGSSSSKRSTKSGEQLWRRLRRVRPRSASREAQRELEDDDMREQRGLEKKLQKMVRENRRREALQTALRLLEGGLKCDPELLVGMLVNAATSPGPEIFAYTLQCAVVAGGLRLTCEEFCKILGIMFFRKAPVPQIRAFLNVALPKDANPVPVIPAGLTAEAEQMFSDERVLPEDCEATSSEEEEEDRSGQPPSAITMQQCKAWPQLNGRYVLYHELCIPGRPVYQKQVAKEDSDCEILEPRNGKDRKRILVYSSDLGWAISKGLKGRWLMTNSREARSPPCLGWQAVKEDGSKVSDPGGFLHKQVGITPRAAPEEPPAQKVQKQTQPGGGVQS